MTMYSSALRYLAGALVSAVMSFGASAAAAEVTTGVTGEDIRFKLRSEKIGENFVIHVALPPTYGAGDKKYPVLYLTDADMFLGMASDLTRILPLDLIEPGVREVILVGIGYENPAWAIALRTRDLTPQGSVSQRYHDMTDSSMPVKQTSGGADDFLEFIESDLDPVIRERFRTDGGKAGILGDSFGGLFTYYAFLKQSPLFDKYWLGSPGLIQEDTRMLNGLAELLQKTDFKGQRVYISVGERELTHNFYGILGRNYSRMVGIFEDNPGKNLSVKSEVFPRATHNTVIAPAMTQALIYLYRDK